MFTHTHALKSYPVEDDSGFLLQQDTPDIDAEDAALMNGVAAPASSSNGGATMQLESFSSSASFKLLACISIGNAQPVKP